MLTRLPFAIAILGMVGGVFIAIVFGVNEAFFKKAIEGGLTRNVAIQQIADADSKARTLEKEAEKNWRYYQRFHFHATGIGAMSLSLLIFLGFVDAPRRLRIAASYPIAVGGFLYPFVWLFAGIYGPEMGRHEAKEAFAIFGYAGGVFLVGTLLALAISLRHPLRARDT